MDARLLQFVTALGAVLLAGCVAAAQSVIELRSSVRTTAGATLTLAQVALLTGDDATAIGSLPVTTLPTTGGTRVLSVDEVRRVIDQSAKVNWGRLSIRGSKCSISVAAEPTAKAAAHAPATAPAKPVDPASVRKAVSDRIARILQIDPTELRLTFAAEDEEILALSVRGRVLEVKPTASSDKLPLALTLFEHDRIIASKTIRVGVLVQRTVVVAAEPKSRGEIIERDDVTIDRQWVGPNLRHATEEQVIGSAAQGKVSAGQVIVVSDVAAAQAVSKGDIISISCVSGSVVVTTKARAMSGGRVGDLVQFQGIEDKRTFSARMSARGRAVLTVGKTEPEANQ